MSAGTNSSLGSCRREAKVSFYFWLIGTLAVWRLTHLLQAEDGPWDIVVWLRMRAGEGIWGRLLDCFYCLSLWIALPVAGLCGDGWTERLVLWPAFSAGAVLIEGARAALPVSPPAPGNTSDEAARQPEKEEI
jgi:hypothetical protein